MTDLQVIPSGETRDEVEFKEMAPGVLRLVLFDGVCGLCDKTIRVLIKLDRKKALMFAPLQGETAARLRVDHPEIPQELKSVVYIEDGRVFLRAQAFMQLTNQLHWPWRFVYYFRWMPSLFTDLFYNMVAAVRYRVFGKHDACQIPSLETRARFLP